jgi:hypothetical protein
MVPDVVARYFLVCFPDLLIAGQIGLTIAMDQVGERDAVGRAGCPDDGG